MAFFFIPGWLLLFAGLAILVSKKVVSKYRLYLLLLVNCVALAGFFFLYPHFF